jgi:hypothetical protein
MLHKITTPYPDSSGSPGSHAPLIAKTNVCLFAHEKHLAPHILLVLVRGLKEDSCTLVLLFPPHPLIIYGFKFISDLVHCGEGPCRAVDRGRFPSFPSQRSHSPIMSS